MGSRSGIRRIRGSLNVDGDVIARGDVMVRGGIPLSPGGGGGEADAYENFPLTNGKTIYVSSTHTAASDSNDGESPDFPMATIDAAVAKCAANKGDVILVSPGHAETVTAANGIDLDVAGIYLIGMGQGENRPIITFGTNATATMRVNAANVTIRNILFKVNVDSLAILLDVDKKDCEVSACEFREGSAKQWLTCIDINGGAANACDRAKIQGCRFISITAGADNAIKLAEIADEVKILDNFIDGDFTDAGIHNPVGFVCTNLYIAGNAVRNRQAGDHAIELVSACTGECVGNVLFGDTAAAILDPGSLFCTANAAQMAIDKPGFGVPLDTEDQVTNAIGVDDADNAFASTNVAANEDGSVLERLEQLQEAVNKGTGTALAANESLVDVLYAANGIATYPAGAAAANNVSIAEVLRYVQDQVINGTGTALAANTSLYGVLAGASGIPVFPAAAAPANDVSIAEVVRTIYDRQLGDGTNAAANSILGKRVSRVTGDIITGAAVPVFTVSGGRVLVTCLTGKVTTIIGAGVTNAKFQFNPTTGTTNDMCGNLDIDIDEAGTLYSITGTAADAMLRSESGAIRNMGSNGIILDVGDIEFITSADRTGSISLELFYVPIDDGAAVAAA